MRVVVGACLLLVLSTVSSQDTDGEVPEQTSATLTQMQTQAQSLAEMQAQSQAQAQARAKAKYDRAMSKMQKLSDKLGSMAEDYEERAQAASDEEAKAAKRERAQVAAAAAEFPFLGLETSEKKHHDALVQDLDDDKDVLAEAMKHKEVTQLITKLDAEHKQLRKEEESDPMASLKHLQDNRKKAKREEAARIMKWQALQDGYAGDPEAPSETDVNYKALVVEKNLEAQGTKLSDAQKEQITEAVRVHEMNNRRIEMTKQRLKKMQELEEEDRRANKKAVATAQAEALYDEQDDMLNKVAEVKAEAKEALESQKRANRPDPTQQMMQALVDLNAVIPESK